MSNRHSFLLTPLDQMVAALSPAARRQIMLDFDELERTGKNGDTLLREEAGRIYRALQRRPSGFDAAYMMFVGLSAHKVASIEAQSEAEDLDLHDRRVLSTALVEDIARLPATDLSNMIDSIQRRAREITGLDEDPHAEGPGCL